MSDWLNSLTPEGYMFVVLLMGGVAGMVIASVVAWWEGRW